MLLNPLIFFMRMLNASFSSRFRRFKPYQDHIFVFGLFMVGLSRYRPRNGRKASLFIRVFNCATSKFCVFLWLLTSSFLKTKVFLDTILTGYLTPVVCWSLLFKFFEQSWDENFTGVLVLAAVKTSRVTCEWRNNGHDHRGAQSHSHVSKVDLSLLLRCQSS